jgi:hypothetical protein
MNGEIENKSDSMGKVKVSKLDLAHNSSVNKRGAGYWRKIGSRFKM